MEHSKAYKIFENMLNEYSKVDVNADCESEKNKTFFFLAQTLTEMNLRNPLPFGEKGYSEYEDMLFFYSKWNKAKKTCAFKQRFIMAAWDLCDAVIENIFDRGPMAIEVESLDQLKEEEYKQAELEDVALDEEHDKAFGIFNNPVLQLKQNYGFVTNYDGESNEIQFPEGTTFPDE